MILDHNISIGTESFNSDQVCVVILCITQLLCTSILEILQNDPEKEEVIYDVKQDLPSSSQRFSFSFDQLLHSPWECTAWFREQLSKIQPLMDSTTRKNVVDKIVGHAAQLAYLRNRERNFNSGYMFEATLELVHFHLSCIEIGKHVAGGDKEEVTICSVCLENLEVGMEFSKLPCSHIFHTSCLDPWLERNKNCPNCRSELVYKDVKEKRLVEYLIEGRNSTT